MRLKTGVIYYLLFIFAGWFLWFLAYNYTDSDLGWHLRMGEIILERGIPRTDLFSYTMPSYEMIDLEWLSQILMAWLMDRGYGALSGFYALLAVGVLGIGVLSIPKKRRVFGLLPLLFGIFILMRFFGARAQVVTWFFFALEMWVIFSPDRLRKWWFVLPVIFLFWANMHGGFALGILALALAGCYWVLKGKIKTQFFLLLLTVSLAFTAMTPYGIGVWKEVLGTVGDGYLKANIVEWMMPFFVLLSFPFWAFLVTSLLLIVREWRRFEKIELLFYCGLLFASLTESRHIPLWLVVALPMTARSLSYLFDEVKKIRYGKERAGKIGLIAIILSCLLVSYDVVNVAASTGAGNNGLREAVVYLRENLPKGQIFSSYAWGGYLVWKMPEKKIFVSGMMPIWKHEAKNMNESNYAFSDYRAFLRGDLSFESTIEKYGITTLLLPIETKTRASLRDQMESEIDRFAVAQNWEFMRDKGVGFGLITGKAKETGWVEVYRNKEVVVYQDKKAESAL